MKSKKYWIMGVVFLFLLCMGGFGSVLGLLYFSSSDWGDTWGDIAIVEVKGPIFESEPTNEKLEKYRKSSSVKAVVLRIDSPGGAVGPSQEIYEEVKKLAGKKKVVVSMGSVAASGGYYIAAPATKIVANPATVTGSIGVLMEHVEIDELLKWAKVSAEILKAGAMKDVGSMFRPMKADERALLEGVLKNMHEQFRKAVSEGRNIPLEEVEKIADGRIYTGEQALALKLVDQLGDLDDAIDTAKDLAGIKGEPKIIRPQKPKSFWKEVFLGGEDGSDSLLKSAVGRLVGPRAFYLMSL
ncbi:MAG: signal peptide peptidase SppA [bacterium]